MKRRFVLFVGVLLIFVHLVLVAPIITHAFIQITATSMEVSFNAAWSTRRIWSPQCAVKHGNHAHSATFLNPRANPAKNSKPTKGNEVNLYHHFIYFLSVWRRTKWLNLLTNIWLFVLLFVIFAETDRSSHLSEEIAEPSYFSQWRHGKWKANESYDLVVNKQWEWWLLEARPIHLCLVGGNFMILLLKCASSAEFLCHRLCPASTLSQIEHTRKESSKSMCTAVWWSIWEWIWDLLASFGSFWVGDNSWGRNLSNLNFCIPKVEKFKFG